MINERMLEVFGFFSMSCLIFLSVLYVVLSVFLCTNVSAVAPLYFHCRLTPGISRHKARPAVTSDMQSI